LIWAEQTPSVLARADFFFDTYPWIVQTTSVMARAESLYYAYPAVEASMENICGLGVLTELNISGEIERAVGLPHNICVLTKLKILKLGLENVKTLPAEMAYSLKQLQELHLWHMNGLVYLPRSFTCCGAFPALTLFEILCPSLVQFPEVDEGALPKLRTLYFESCSSLETLPLSLEKLTSLKKLIVVDGEKMKDSCRRNCEKSSIWERLVIYRTNIPKLRLTFRGIKKRVWQPLPLTPPLIEKHTS
jgi:hypothetical protein